MSGVQSRRVWLNLLLLLLVAGLAWLAWWWQTAGSYAGGPSGLLDLPLSGVVSIEVDRNPADPGKEVLVLRKHEHTWYMEQPKEQGADPVRVRQLLTLLEEPVEAEYAAEGLDLSQYGLIPGQLLIRFNQEALLLGDANPVSDRRYILHKGRLKLVHESVFSSLSGDWSVFAAKP